MKCTHVYTTKKWFPDVKMEVFISESSVEKAVCDWAVDWIFI